MDLSKAFDTLNHVLLIEKIHEYDVRKKSFKLLFTISARVTLT